jgi:phosphatidylglycerol---prolipoprotein diacylglyceryl transferase
MTDQQRRTGSPPGASFRRASASPVTKDRLGNQPSPSPEPNRGSVAARTGSLKVSAFNCEALAEVEPQALGLTYEFVAAPEGDPYSVTIAFEGRRAGVKNRPLPSDRFDVSTTVERVLPGSGRVAVTTRVPNLTAGSWSVVARPSVRRVGSGARASDQARAGLPRLPEGAAEGSTGWAGVIQQQAPGVLLGSWAALVGLGAAVAVGLQGILAAHLGLSVVGVVLVSLVSSLIGLIGAKVYYLAVYPAKRRQALIGGGMCIQGFVLGAAAGLAVGSWVAGIPIGPLLDLTAPALMFGMTIGRFGCFFSGCCVGRPTASRWGLWSSDRQLGVRRIPTQLLESALAATIGGIALVMLLMTNGIPGMAGAIFIGAMAAYVLGRQLLLRLRAESPKTRHGRVITLAVAATILAADLIAATVTYAQ